MHVIVNFPSSGHHNRPPGSILLCCVQRGQSHRPGAERVHPDVPSCLAASHQLQQLSGFSEPRGEGTESNSDAVSNIQASFQTRQYFNTAELRPASSPCDFQIDANKDVALNIYMEGRGFAIFQVRLEVSSPRLLIFPLLHCLFYANTSS